MAGGWRHGPARSPWTAPSPSLFAPLAEVRPMLYYIIYTHTTHIYIYIYLYMYHYHISFSTNNVYVRYDYVYEHSRVLRAEDGLPVERGTHLE